MRTIVGTDFLGDGDPDFEERVAPGVLGTEVALNHPTQAEWDPVTETLLVPSWHNHRVRQWDPATGNSLVVCANTAIDDGNGANAGFAGDGGPPEDALFAFPNSIAVHPETGEFWLLDQRNNRIRWVAADRSVIDTVAGNGEATFAGDGGGALDASFNFWDIADLQPEPAGGVEYVDGTLYVADTSNHAVRVIDLEADLVSSIELGQRLTDSACDPDAWCFPSDVELGPDGRLYVADTGNHVIRAVDLDTGAVEVVAGTFEQADGGEGLLATETALDRPHGVDFADDGALLIADTYNHRIRRVAP
jgi:DNA-binding beta-propeller fold protein YncE